jgi:hypothetical protein
MKKAEKLAEYLDDHARSELDNEAAATLRELGLVYDVAYEMVHAKTDAHSRDSYVQMIDLIKGKKRL